MKLIALVTIVTGKGELPPGSAFSLKDAAEAESLVERGFAKPAEEAKAQADAEAEAKARAEAEAQAAEAARLAAQANQPNT